MIVAVVALVVSIAGGVFTAYNTLISRRSLRWQQNQDAERGEQRVEIHFEHDSIIEPTNDPETWRLGGVDRVCSYRLRVIVVNRSETSVVWIRAVYVDTDCGESCDLIRGDGRPHRLVPGEPLVRSMLIDPAEWDVSWVRAIAHVAPDDWIHSERATVPPALLGRVLVFNTCAAQERLDIVLGHRAAEARSGVASDAKDVRGLHVA
jgi:hypothetical protein